MRSLSFETLLGASAQVRGHDHRDAARARRVRPRAKHAVRRPLGRKQGDGRPVSRDVGGDTGRYRETQGDTAALSIEMCGEMWGDTGRYGRPTRGRRHACPRRLRPCRRHPRSRRPRRLAASLREGWRRSTGPSRTQAGRRERRGIAPVPLATHSQTHGWTGALLPQEMLAHLLSGRLLNGWVLRQTLEACATYACAVGRLTSSPYASTEYAVISGVRKGTILARGARCDGGPVPSPPESERTEGESGREPRERAERESLE